MSEERCCYHATFGPLEKTTLEKLRNWRWERYSWALSSEPTRAGGADPEKFASDFGISMTKAKVIHTIDIYPGITTGVEYKQEHQEKHHL